MRRFSQADKQRSNDKSESIGQLRFTQLMNAGAGRVAAISPVDSCQQTKPKNAHQEIFNSALALAPKTAIMTTA
jgi:hypothetical protein